MQISYLAFTTKEIEFLLVVSDPHIDFGNVKILLGISLKIGKMFVDMPLLILENPVVYQSFKNVLHIFHWETSSMFS